MKYAFFVIIAIAYLQADRAEFELTGTVKSTDGKPIQDVLVYSQSLGGRGSGLAFTGENGRYHLKSSGRVAFFSRRGFKPTVKLLDRNTRYLDITLESISDRERMINFCLNEDASRKAGGKLRVIVPVNAIVRGGKSDDAQEFSIAHSSQQKQSWLTLVWGQMASHGFPPEKWILDSADFTVATIRLGNYQWNEYRGHTATGRYWRFVGRAGEQLSYYDVTQNTAEYFDSIINSACLNK